VTDPSLPVVVCYVAGTGRTGSTLLANLLGQLPDYASVGEVRYVWERGMIEDRLCGCGERFSACPVWQEVVERTRLDPDTPVTEIAAVHDAMLRLRELPRLWRADRATLPGAELAHLERIERLYRAIRDATGASVVVDASKLPTYALLLDLVPSIDLRVLHLVRDPRGVAHSWQRTKELSDGSSRRHMLRQGTARSAALWQVWNRMVERRFGRDPARYVRVRYEDFVAQPRPELEPVVAMTGGDAQELPIAADGTIRLAPTHTVAGNPNRLVRGDVRLAPDDAWSREMPAGRRLVVDGLSVVTNRHYGYPWW
jgi:hypothetical protein